MTDNVPNETNLTPAKGMSGGCVLAAGWLALVALGFWSLLQYENSPCAASTAPRGWPASSGMTRPAERMTMVMFAHPRCPCSRASIQELAKLMRRNSGKVATYVVFLHSEHFGERWTKSALWDEAARIPGVTVKADGCGLEARKFGTTSSGSVLVYDSAGKLQFSGGITSARSHEGDNAGADAINALLARSFLPHQIVQTPVFGCSLVNPAGSRDAGRKI